MNTVIKVLYISSRTYTRNVRIPGIRNKVRLLKDTDSEVNPEELDCHDLDEFEAEYMNVGQSYEDHVRELKTSKELLKNRIVVSKYFKKDKEPNFLTSIEKDEIKKLHQSDPEEWTVEALSRSFPALPDTIKKILKSNWSYRSVEQILQYDAAVIDNWKQFKSGKLSLDPLLQEHLTKFQDRKIVLPDRHVLAEKLMLPKPKLPDPNSKFFSNIVLSSLDQDRNNQSEKLIQDSTNNKDGQMATAGTNVLNNTIKDNSVSKNIYDKRTSMEKTVANKNVKALTGNKGHSSKPKLILTEFIRKELLEMYKHSPEKAIVLLSTHKKHFEECDDISSNAGDNKTQSKDVSTYKQQLEECDDTSFDVEKNMIQMECVNSLEKTETLSSLNKTETPQDAIVESVPNELDTHVKIWNTKKEDNETYSQPIKIPRNLHREGATYRISDCYYDEDGEFIFRTPGLKN